MFHLHVWESILNNMQFPEKAGRPERHYPMDLRIVETAVSETAVSELCIIAMRKD